MTEIFQPRTFDPLEVEQTFEKFKFRLQSILPVETDIQHIGATAVSGCASKGDLDICVRVAQKDFASCDAALEGSFIRNAGSTQTEYFSSFVAEDAGIQLVIKNSSLDIFVEFRDLLIQNPKLIAEYNKLNQDYNNKPMMEYRAAKDQFIEIVLLLT